MTLMLLALPLVTAAPRTPVIAIMSHPAMLNDTATADTVESAGAGASASSQSLSKRRQYMAASYVKWLELAGARVMPLSYHSTDAEVDRAFSQVNGALFMGGGAQLPAAARRLWSRAVAANAAGDHFPIWGSCLGFEWIMQLASGDDHILAGGFDSENLTLPLNLTAAAASSRILAPAASTPVAFAEHPRSILDALALPVTMNNHQQGVTPAAFAASDALTKTFSVLSTNADRTGRAFVSTVEGKAMPVWAAQWHPEKNIFEQGAVLPEGYPYEVVQHTLEAVMVSQYFANFFVAQCRESTHAFASAEEEWGSLIYRYTTSLAYAPAFEQVYFFDY